ncbi:MAG: type II toxin-antitoxin system RelE/ParE family toxin [Bacteroidales bacterium]|nr:type II toxin-antitoxin system RelE/ParE family toxin [Bacteroidales bacterium]
MAKLSFTNKAVDDLSSIWNYSFLKWSEFQADTYYWMLMESCKMISINPNIGKKYTNIAASLKGYKSGKHIIFYRQYEENSVEIIRILHEQMDLNARIIEK